ncbi:MAG: cytochrome c peroxidase [Bacteroidia bacterium]|nr:cytochrome c peroxidase [Bacteroidia bacterium]
MKNGIIISLTLLCLAASNITIPYPNYFPKPNYELDFSSKTYDLTQLGRVLFYDPILSADNTISCASCHSPYNSFAHTDHAVSHGIHDSIGKRNAPALINLAWQKELMWDGASNHLDVQALAPITHPGEMAESIEHVINKLQNNKLYPPLFKKAYGDMLINSQRMLKALTQFQLTLISDNSKYDKVRRSEDTFSIQENKGYGLFLTHCNSCHTEPLFTNHKYKNNGLGIDSQSLDLGRFNITKIPYDSVKFKVPTLRNIGYTYPYMHDGRFKKLSSVINHYISDNKEYKYISKELEHKISLSSNDKSDLISFLLTLNDRDFIFNPKNKFPRKILLQPKDI